MDNLVIHVESQLTQLATFMLSTKTITASNHLQVRECLEAVSVHTAQAMECLIIHAQSQQLTHPIKFSLSTNTITASNHLQVREYM